MKTSLVKASILAASLLAGGATTAIAFDPSFTNGVARSGEGGMRACNAGQVDERLDCVARVLDQTAQRLQERPDYRPAAVAFSTAASKVRAARTSAKPPKEKIAIAKAAMDEAKKVLMSAQSGHAQAEYAKLSKVPETAKGVLKA
jgi:hypothetical protein